ncbi:unnamed protein product [Moneuplotes crassus]|uniref:Conserved oligomeric Golgi complex subunit 7 n=1 Tax=Euplotes crassus TaxID=5936 RepID=A0AAD1XVE8_EUPCR|nr:unnamed protein product [Moneuplotes crassus]
MDDFYSDSFNVTQHFKNHCKQWFQGQSVGDPQSDLELLNASSKYLKNIHSFQKEQMGHLDTFFDEVSDFLQNNSTKEIQDGDKGTELYLPEIEDAFNDIFQVNKVIDRLKSIKQITDETQHFESELKKMEELLENDGSIYEIEQVLIALVRQTSEKCINLLPNNEVEESKNSSLMEEKREKVQYYKEKVKAYLNQKFDDIEAEGDITFIQTSLRIYKLMGIDQEFLHKYIKAKILPEFNTCLYGLDVNKDSGRKVGYFEGLQKYIERRVDMLCDLFGNNIDYLIVIFEQISERFIDTICSDFLSHKQKFGDILDKLTGINDIMRAKLINQIQDFEMSDGQGPDPNDLVIRAHTKMFQNLCTALLEDCTTKAKKLIVEPVEREDFRMHSLNSKYWEGLDTELIALTNEIIEYGYGFGLEIFFKDIQKFVQEALKKLIEEIKKSSEKHHGSYSLEKIVIKQASVASKEETKQSKTNDTLEPTDEERMISQKVKEMNSSEIIPENITRIHYIEKFLYSCKKYESELISILEGLKPTGLHSSLSSFPIYFDIKDCLNSNDFFQISNLYNLKSQFEVSQTTDKKPIVFGKEVGLLRDKCKDFIVNSFALKFHYEIYHYDALRVWRDQKFEEEDTPDFSMPPTENIRKISNCFISVILQFDTPEMEQLSNKDQIYTDFFAFISLQEEGKVKKNLSQFYEMIQFWIGILGNTTLKLLKQKIDQIEALSPQGCNQLKTDLDHILNILCNFDLSEGLLNYFSSCLFTIESRNIKKNPKDKTEANLASINEDKAAISSHWSSQGIAVSKQVEVDQNVVDAITRKINRYKQMKEEMEDEEEESEEEKKFRGLLCLPSLVCKILIIDIYYLFCLDLGC